MSECVVRMEMPQSCCECRLRQEDYDTGEEFCPFTGVECLSIGRQDNCPIICSLPEGHGRLVDADAVYKRANGKYGDSEILAVAMEFYGAPTIVPAAAERSET